MREEQELVTVRILDKEFRIGCDKGEKEALIARDWDRLVVLAQRSSKIANKSNHGGSTGP